MEIIITDVTILGDQISVAGWYHDEGRMVRPLQGECGCHWDSGLAGPHLFHMGNIVKMQPVGLKNNRGLPHAKEDTIVLQEPVLIRKIPALELPDRLAASESPGVEDIFLGQMEERRLVRRGASCPSLGAVQVEASSLSFYEKETENGPQLRLRFIDASGECFNFPVASKPLRDLWQRDGIYAVGAPAMRHHMAHVRVGLAHPLPGDECFATVDNILFF